MPVVKEYHVYELRRKVRARHGGDEETELVFGTETAFDMVEYLKLKLERAMKPDVEHNEAYFVRNLRTEEDSSVDEFLKYHEYFSWESV